MKDIFWLKWGCAMYRRDFQDKSKSEHNLYEVLSAIIFFPLPFFFNPSVSLWPLNSSKYLAIGVSPVWMYMYILHHCYLVTLKLSNYLPYFKFAIRCNKIEESVYPYSVAYLWLVFSFKKSHIWFPFVIANLFPSRVWYTNNLSKKNSNRPYSK